MRDRQARIPLIEGNARSVSAAAAVESIQQQPLVFPVAGHKEVPHLLCGAPIVVSQVADYGGGGHERHIIWSELHLTLLRDGRLSGINHALACVPALSTLVRISDTVRPHTTFLEWVDVTCCLNKHNSGIMPFIICHGYNTA